MQNDIDPEKRAQLLEFSALATQETLHGLTLRPMNWTTYSLYNRIKDASSSSQEHTFTIMLFVFLHSAPEAKLRANCAKPENLLPEIFDFMQERKPQEFKDFESWSLLQIEKFSASITASDPVIGGVSDPKA